THAGLAFRLVAGTGGASADIRQLKGIFNAANGQTTRGIRHRVADYQTHSDAIRVQPSDAVMKYALCVVVKVRPRSAAASTGEAGDIRLQAENEVAVLPIIADLPATDEAGGGGGGPRRSVFVSG